MFFLVLPSRTQSSADWSASLTDDRLHLPQQRPGRQHLHSEQRRKEVKPTDSRCERLEISSMTEESMMNLFRVVFTGTHGQTT
jgi:hypothetical protein